MKVGNLRPSEVNVYLPAEDSLGKEVVNSVNSLNSGQWQPQSHSAC